MRRASERLEAVVRHALSLRLQRAVALGSATSAARAPRRLLDKRPRGRRADLLVRRQQDGTTSVRASPSAASARSSWTTPAFMSKTPGPVAASPSRAERPARRVPSGHTVSRWPTSSTRGVRRTASAGACARRRSTRSARRPRSSGGEPVGDVGASGAGRRVGLGDSASTSARGPRPSAGAGARSAATSEAKHSLIAGDSRRSAGDRRFGGFQSTSRELVVTDHAAAHDAWNHRRMASHAARSAGCPHELASAPPTRRAVRRERAGVDIRPLDSLAELEAGSQLIAHIWDDDEPKAPTSLLRALVACRQLRRRRLQRRRARRRLLRLLRPRRDRLPPALAHHGRRRRDSEQIARIRAEAVPALLGACARHAEHRLDGRPARARQPLLQPVKLGATIVAYHADFYGPLRDGLNAGEESDRVLCAGSSHPIARSRPPTSLRPSRREAWSSRPRAGTDGVPVADGRSATETLLAWIPDDIVRLREQRPGQAHAWRQAVRGDRRQRPRRRLPGARRSRVTAGSS